MDDGPRYAFGIGSHSVRLIRTALGCVLYAGLMFQNACAPDDDKDRGFVAKGPASGDTRAADAVVSTHPLGSKTPASQAPPAATPPENQTDDLPLPPSDPGTGKTVESRAQTTSPSSPQVSTAPSPSCSVGVQTTQERFVAAQLGLNVRSDPGAGAALLGALREGIRVKIWGGQRLVAGEPWVCGSGKGTDGRELIGWMKEAHLRT